MEPLSLGWGATATLVLLIIWWFINRRKPMTEREKALAIISQMRANQAKNRRDLQERNVDEMEKNDDHQHDRLDALRGLFKADNKADGRKDS